MTDALDPRVHSAIEHECTALMIEYARSIDFRDYDNIENLFTEDAVLIIGQRLSGRDEIVHAIKQRPGELRSRHVITNPFVDVIDARNARGICYLTLYRHHGPESLAQGPIDVRGPAAVGHFEDTFVRTATGWRISYRVLHLAFSDPEQL